MVFQGAALGALVRHGAQGDKDTCPRGETQIPPPREGGIQSGMCLLVVHCLCWGGQAFPKPFILK